MNTAVKLGVSQAARTDAVPPEPAASEHAATQPKQVELLPWVGGSIVWAAMTAAMTRKAGPALLSGGVAGAAAITRTVMRDRLPADSPDAHVIASGAVRGALMGAAVGACLAAGATEFSAISVLRKSRLGLAVGIPFGLVSGLVEAKMDKYHL